MSRFRSADEDEGEIDVTPMLDVVFILLIFFIVSTSFVREPGLEPERTPAETARHQARAEILVAVGSNGSVWMQGNRVSTDAVRVLAEQNLARAPGTTAIVIGDRNAPAGIILDVLSQLQRAGVTDTTLGAAPADD